MQESEPSISVLQAGPPGPAAERSLRERFVRGSLITVTGFGVGQSLRFAGNVVLAHLLYPQAFGVMTVVWSIAYALEMLSDIGVGPAVIRHERGGQARFLDTAWTVGLLRGLALWLIACALTPFLARFYGEPQLLAVLPVAAFTATIGALASTKLHTARRRMEFGRLTLIEILGPAAGLAVMIPWALIQPSVWTLVGGALVGSGVRAVLSHTLLHGESNRLRIDGDDARALWQFSRWITAGSALQVVNRQSDRLVMGRLGGLAVLGSYGLAGQLADALHGIGQQLSREILLPALSTIVRERPADLQRVFYRARLRMDSGVLGGLGLLCGGSPAILGLLYDERYAAMVWMLQALCVRTALFFAADTAQTCLVALHRLHYQVLPVACKAAWVVVGLPVGWYLGGLAGLVWAGALSELPALAVLWIGLRREGVLRPAREGLGLCFFAVGLALAQLLALALGGR